ncbi:MAG TPA: hypothetical protein VEJ18_09855, partial [Planctomycetota bacterium]|nr:hypothetical protein [Planctomycetota bacterium]
LDMAARLGAWPGVMLSLSAPAAGLALAATPLLARALVPGTRWPVVSFTVWIAVVAVTSVGSLPGEPLGRLTFEGWTAGILLVVLVAAIVGLLRSLRAAALRASAGSRPRAG